MGAIVGIVVGVTLAAFGFVTMRNPMRLNVLPLNPVAEGHYQRMVLDTPTRNGLRILGALVCLFGSSILTAGFGAALRLQSLTSISEGLWVLMGCLFIGAWVSGAVLSVWQLSKGQAFNWFEALKLSAQLGPVDVVPSMTPRMQRESRIYTAALLTLAGIAALMSVLR